jgi:hypothetical protein
MRDPDAYRGAHERVSTTSMPVLITDPASRGGDDASLLDVIVDAMERLDQLNPPTG